MPTAELDTYVALLRGINVGGHNKLPMRDLSALLAELGCQGVQTYIQSGNAVFRAPVGTDGLAEAISRKIQERFGFTSTVILRSRDELAAVTRANPFPEDVDPAKLLIVFLETEPAPENVASLDPNFAPPDAFAVRGREVFIHCPDGLARTKTPNYVGRRLKTTGTGRNWRTVLKLLEMADSTHAGA
ncbi:MAG TPA: DUF1697 domain-containing protein [Oscillatoriaceae cyanobacterium]